MASATSPLEMARCTYQLFWTLQYYKDNDKAILSWLWQQDSKAGGYFGGRRWNYHTLHQLQEANQHSWYPGTMWHIQIICWSIHRFMYWRYTVNDFAGSKFHDFGQSWSFAVIRGCQFLRGGRILMYLPMCSHFTVVVRGTYFTQIVRNSWSSQKRSSRQ